MEISWKRFSHLLYPLVSDDQFSILLSLIHFSDLFIHIVKLLKSASPRLNFTLFTSFQFSYKEFRGNSIIRTEKLLAFLMVHFMFFQYFPFIVILQNFEVYTCTYKYLFCNFKDRSYYEYTMLSIPFLQGLRTSNEGIYQRNLKMWANVSNKICFGVSKNLEVGLDFLLCSEGDFLTGRSQPVSESVCRLGN